MQTPDFTPVSGFSRRSALRLGLGSIAAALFAKSWQGQAFAQTPAAPAPTGPYTLPPLPYAYEALEPNIDTWTMQIHHNKHHQAYIDNANRLLVDHPELAKTLTGIRADETPGLNPLGIDLEIPSVQHPHESI